MTTTSPNCSCCCFNPWPHIGMQHKQALDGFISAVFGSSSSSSGFGADITKDEFIQLVCSKVANLFESVK